MPSNKPVERASQHNPPKMHSRSGTPVVASGSAAAENINSGVHDREPEPQQAGAAEPDTPAPPQREDMSNLGSRRTWSLFACSCLLQFVLAVDMASVAVSLPIIARDLAASQLLTFTLATGYFLSQTVFQLVFSHISHGLGRKYVYLSGVLIWIIGASIAAGSNKMPQLVAARFVQGVGAAGMYTMSAIVVVEILPLRKRAAYTAISQAFGALGNICGPLFAALLFKKFTWRSIFVLELILAAPLLAALAFFLPTWKNRQTKLLTVLKKCDWIGMFFFMATSILILVFISTGGVVSPWGSWETISYLVAGLLCLFNLFLHQRFLAKNPAFPTEVFSKPVTNAAFAGSLVSGMLLNMVFYNLVIFWEGVRQLSTIRVGLMLLSVTLTYAVSAAAVGLIIKKCGHIKWATIVGSLCAVLGLGLMWFMDETMSTPPLVLISIVAATGCGIFLPAMINTVLVTTEEVWHSHAIAHRTLVFTAGQCMGISIGLAVFTQAFTNSRYLDIVGMEAGTEVVITPQSLLRVIKDLGPGSGVIHLVVNALRYVWGTACVTAAVTGVVTSIFKCPALPNDREHEQGPVDPVNNGADEEMGLRRNRKRSAFSSESFKMAILPKASKMATNTSSGSGLEAGPSNS